MGDEIAKEIIYNNSHSALSVYERLSTHTVTTASSTIDINIDYSYDDFFIVYNGVKFSNTGNERFTCTFLDKTNTELNSGHYQYSYENSTTDGTKKANYANTENNITLAKTVKTDSPSTGQIHINNMAGYKNSGDKYISMDYHTQSKYDTHFSNITGSALINHNIRLRIIRFKFETSQITAGTFTLYTIRTGNHNNADDNVWDRIEVHNITNASAKIDLDITSDYDNYLVYFDGITRGTNVDTNDDEFYITGESTSGIITGTNYMYTFNEIKSDGDYNVYYANDEANIPITKFVKDGNFFNGTLHINNKNTLDSGGNNTTFDFSTQSRTTLLSSCRGSGMITHTDRINKLNCRFANNQISGGKITLFGLRNSPTSDWSMIKDTSGNETLAFTGTVGVTGDINFTGKLYQNGTEFVGGGGGGGGGGTGSYGVWKKLEVIDVASSTAGVEVNLDYTYRDYLLTYNGVKFSNTGTNRFVFTTYNQSGELATNEYQYTYNYDITDGTGSTHFANSEDNVTIARYVQTDTLLNGELKINNTEGYLNSGDKYISFSHTSQAKKGTDYVGYNGSGLINDSNKPTKIKFKFLQDDLTTVDNIAGGKFILYALQTEADSENLWKRVEAFSISSDTSEIALNLNNNYQNYIVVCDGLRHNGSGVDELNIIANDASADITTGAYQYAINEYRSDGVSNRYYANTEVNLPIAKEVKDGNILNSYIYINNKDGMGSSGKSTSIEFHSETKMATYFSGYKGSGLVNHTNNMTGMKLKFLANSIAGGTVTLYAMKLTGDATGEWDSSGSQIISYMGNVGIGINSPDTELHIYSVNKDQGAYLTLESDGGSGGVPDSAIVFKTNDGSPPNPNINSGTYEASKIYSSWQSGSGNWENSFIGFQTHHNNSNVLNDSMIIKGGNVGIGTTTPGWPLDIQATGADLYATSYSSYFHRDMGYTPGSTTGFVYPIANETYNNVCLNCNGNIVCSVLITRGTASSHSDKRIKTDIEDVLDDEALNIINNLECKKYHYTDPIRRNPLKTIGFIAQEVKDKIPNAVLIVNEYIPDEMRLINNPQWSQENILTLSDLDLSGNNTGKVRFYVSDDPSGNDVAIKDIMVEDDKKTFIFDKKYNNVFLYGKEVNDFHAIDKAQIFALHHSAIQELSRRNDTKTQKIQQLEADNIELKKKVSALENQMAIVKNKLGI